MSLSEQELSEKTVEAVKKYVPKFKVISKETSWFHKTIGAILKVFGNPSYMENYFTTIGYTVAMPKGTTYLNWRATWHEAGHGLQAKKWTRLLFGALYLQGTPVWLVAAALLCWPFFVWLPWWADVAFLAVFALLSFPPFGYWRAHWELQMYGMSLAVRHWNGYTIDEGYINDRSKEFTTGFYFWMCPFPKLVKKKLQRYHDQAQSGEIFKGRYGYFYAHAYKTMKDLGLVKVPATVEP